MTEEWLVFPVVFGPAVLILGGLLVHMWWIEHVQDCVCVRNHADDARRAREYRMEKPHLPPLRPNYAHHNARCPGDHFVAHECQWGPRHRPARISQYVYAQECVVDGCSAVRGGAMVRS